MEETLEGYRLSPQQRHLWLLQKESYDPAYSTTCVVRLIGPVDMIAFKGAIAELIEQQEILRTSFRFLPGMTTPLQVIAESGSYSSEEEDLSADTEAERMQRIEQACKEAKWAVEHGSLVSFKLFRVAAEEHVMVVSVPALCGDSVGVANLVRELAQIYAGQQSTSEAEGPIQYLIASEWQNRLLEGTETEAGREYWREREGRGSGAGARLPLARKAQSEFAPGRVTQALPAETVQEIERLGARADFSTAAFLLGCWQVLLWRLTKANRIVVGTAFAGRSYPELAAALGLFTRYLPLEVELSGSERLQEVVQRAAAALAEAAEWQEYFSWEEWAQPGAGAGERGQAYCNFAFGYEEWTESFTAGEMQWRFEEVSSCVERYQVKLECRRSEEGMELTWHYDSAELSAAAVERLAEQFATLVASACAEPAEQIARLEVVSERERVQVVEEWNQTAVPYEAAECLHQEFEQQVALRPEATAVVYEGAVLSYAELNRRANQVAHYLREQGVGPEAVVGVLLERSAELVVSLLGVLKAGAAYLPLDASYPPARLSYMLRDAGVAVLLTAEELLERVGEVSCRVVCVGTEWEEIGRRSEANVASGVSGKNVAYVIYTSGSTGQPKGVMITHGAIVNHMQWLGEHYPLTETDAVLQKTPISFDASVWEFYAPLLAGGRLVLARPGGQQDSEYLVEVLRQEQVSILQVVPSLLRLLGSEAGLAGCGALRRVFSGGERLTAELAEQLWERLERVELVNLYGPTEATIDATYWQCSGADEEVPIGRPVANLKTYVVEEQQQLAPVGAAGELLLGGAGLARGYLRRPEVTAEKFIPDQYGDGRGERLYRTGDLVRYRLNGALDYVGRADGQMKVRGHRIEVGEIEQRLRQHPAVVEAVVTGKGAAEQIERLVGYLVLQPGTELRVEELRRHMEETLPGYMVPSAWVQLERLPLLANAKVDRLALPEPDNTRPELEKAYVAPRTMIEQTLADIWSEVLGISQVGIDDNFFALGGDSIRSIQVMALAREKGLNFSIQQLFEHQSIDQLAQILEVSDNNSEVSQRTEPFGLISEQDRLQMPLEVEDAYPLTSLQSGMLYHMELRAAGAPVYHNVNSFHVRAELNVPALQRAIQRVVDRHPIMRTAFELIRFSEPLQLVYKTALIEVFEGEDLSHLTTEQQQEVISRSMRNEYERTFDVACPPLVRFSIHRRSPQTFQYTLTECHAISDGWSTTSMFAEIFKYYFAELNNESAVEDPLPSFTFRDFVHLEQEALASPACQSYWSEKLKDVVPMRLPRWPLTHANGGEAKKHGFVGLVFGAELYEGLKRLAQLAEVPLKSVLLTAHMKVLSITCAQADVMTALATNGRPEERGGDRVRGLFINMIPFRVCISDGSWLELVKETFAGEREMLPYRRYPLAAIQKNYNQQRLLETAFNFVHFHSLENVVRSGKVELISSGTKDMADTSFTMNTSFTIGITSLTAPRLEMGLEYDGAELTEEQVKSIVDSYIKTMKAMARDPHAPHTQLNTTHLLTEKDQLLLAQSTHVEELAGSFTF